MNTQRSCQHIVQCTKCNNDILRSELRKVDFGLHYHFTCPKSVELIANKAMINMFKRVVIWQRKENKK